MVLVCPNCSSRFKVKAEALGEKGRLVRCAKCSHKWHAAISDLQESGGSAKPTPEKVPPAKKAAAPKAAPPKPTTPKPAAPKPAAAVPEPDPVPEDAAPPEPAEPETAEPDAAEPDFAGPDALAHLDQEDAEADAAEEKASDDVPSGLTGEFDRSPPPIPPASHFEPREPPTRKIGPWISWGVLVGFIVLFVSGTLYFAKPLVESYPGAAKIFMAVGYPIDLLGHGFELPQPVAEAHPDKTPRTLVVKGVVVNTTGDTMKIPLLKGSLRDTDGVDLASWAFRATREEALPGESVPYETETSEIPQGATTVAVTFLTEQEAQEQGLLKDGE